MLVLLSYKPLGQKNCWAIDPMRGEYFDQANPARIAIRYLPPPRSPLGLRVFKT